MRLLRQPLFHFLLLGVALFLLFSLLGERSVERADAIVVTEGDIQRWAQAWQEAWQRPPTQEELDGLIEDRIREEVLYREARAMGLDEEDIVIRRRLRQKMESLSQQLTEVVEPTEKQLQVYFEDHAEQFEIPSVLSFRQIYFDVEERGDAAAEDARSILAGLETGEARDIAALGDTFLLPQDYDAYPIRDVVRLFGQEFADALSELPQGRWAGPVPSGSGLHLVLLQDRIPARAPDLDEVRGAVRRRWLEARRAAAGEEFYQDLRRRYVISVERPESQGGQSPSGTVP